MIKVVLSPNVNDAEVFSLKINCWSNVNQLIECRRAEVVPSPIYRMSPNRTGFDRTTDVVPAIRMSGIRNFNVYVYCRLALFQDVSIQKIRRNNYLDKLKQLEELSNLPISASSSCIRLLLYLPRLATCSSTSLANLSIASFVSVWLPWITVPASA